jgi:hypothetical protein
MVFSRTEHIDNRCGQKFSILTAIPKNRVDLVSPTMVRPPNIAETMKLLLAATGITSEQAHHRLVDLMSLTVGCALLVKVLCPDQLPVADEVTWVVSTFLRGALYEC